MFVKGDMIIDRPVTYGPRIFTALINNNFLLYLSAITPVIIDLANGMYYSITINNLNKYALLYSGLNTRYDLFTL